MVIKFSTVTVTVTVTIIFGYLLINNEIGFPKQHAIYGAWNCQLSILKYENHPCWGPQGHLEHHKI